MLKVLGKKHLYFLDLVELIKITSKDPKKGMRFFFSSGVMEETEI